MPLPYVIDNRDHRLAHILNDLPHSDTFHAVDVATAYFNVGAETLALVGALTRYLRRAAVAVRLYRQGFLHAKAYLCFVDKHPGDRFVPVAGIVGSANFTCAGLATNQELNLTHKAVLTAEKVEDRETRAAIAPLLGESRRPLGFSSKQQDGPTAGKAQRSGAERAERRAIKSEVGARAILDLLDWYDVQWAEAEDFKQDLIDLLDASKFGGYEYTPYEVYLKTLYTYFRDELEGDVPLPGTRSAVELTRFQEDAVKRARRILARYDGVMIADSVGLGKTWIGKKLLEDTAYHRRQKALVICPASLREIWRGELREVAIPAEILSQEMLGREEVGIRPYRDVDVILIDESHNFRNHRTNRYDNLERLIGANGGRGRDGERKKIILLTATPINNTIFDLYNQIMLFAQGDRAYFAGAGIGDLRRFFLEARRRAGGNGAGVSLGETAALFNLEAYKRTGLERDEMELGRQSALVGIFKTRFLKRFESSVAAFRISIHRALTFLETFRALLAEDKLLDSATFHHALRYLEQEGEDGEDVSDRVEAFNANDETREMLEGLPELDTSQYDLTRIEGITAVAWREVRRALKALRTPLSGAYLREAYEAYSRDGGVAALLEAIRTLDAAAEPEQAPPDCAPRPITREDLYLVCWEYVWS